MMSMELKMITGRGTNRISVMITLTQMTFSRLSLVEEQACFLIKEASINITTLSNIDKDRDISNNSRMEDLSSQ